ncbi:hypothetical protein P3W85_01170 [Cupriavidus basilensis]|uniref:Fumarase C C-terminal domain-containing protein n=1 Tax=Cupriavidus basilensis TaxID=68895 RepID=A0ABT6AG47_9BURK|nr:hypothetical protein [Cupriavidus basilensis]MDF3831577.1 hypothetical protein [Cupriavidus basilensis]
MTALNPYIGYANATAVAQEAHSTGGSVYEIVLRGVAVESESYDRRRRCSRCYWRCTQSHAKRHRPVHLHAEIDARKRRCPKTMPTSR